MTTTEPYADILKRIIREYAAIKPSYGDVQVETIFDDAQGHYELMYAGWHGSRRIHGSVIHADIRDDKVWIQHDGIADELIEAGIPKEHIVLAFHAPNKRRFTSFATG